MNKKVTKLLNVESLKPNFILATDIYQYNSKVILYKKGTVLTSDKINKLKKFGIISVQVDIDHNYQIESPNDVITSKKIESDFKIIYEYANYIVSSVLNKKDIKSMLNKVDSGLNDHCQKVALFATMIGMNLENFDKDKLEQLAISALLHDIGKSTIDFAILNKPGKLTNEEYSIIQGHCQNGYDILKATDMFDPDVCEAVLSHHENEDGSGYPNHKKENEIPLYSRIIHICDVYSALTTERCYKNAWSSDKAFKIIDDENFKYEPHLLKIFKTALPIYLKNDIVLLSTNELGTVIDSSSNRIVIKQFGNKGIINLNANNDNRVYIKKKIKSISSA